MLPNTPSPDHYMHKSMFEDGKNRGKSFGGARERSPDRSHFIPQIHKNPGPGNVHTLVIPSMRIRFIHECMRVLR